MEPLSSKVLNDQILSMRSEVKKVIVHQIHGLTRKIDKLRMKKGTEEQKEKNGTKADNYASEVLLLKKLKPEEVSLFALANPEESELSRLIAKQVISLQTRATAKLCLRENIKKIVKDFITKYSDSLELLSKLINERYEKTCNPNKNKKRKKKRGKSKKLDTKEQEINAVNDENLSDSNESIPQLVPVSNSLLISSDDAERLSQEESQSGEENDSHTQYSDDSSDSDLANEEEPEMGSIATNNKEGFFKREWKGVNTDSTVKNKNLKNKGNNNPKENINSSSLDIEDKNIISTAKDISQKKKNQNLKSVDPFFKTKDDSEYLTYCDVRNISNDQSNFKERNYEGELIAEERKDRNTFRGGYKGGSYGGGKMSGSFSHRDGKKTYRGGSKQFFNKSRENRDSFKHDYSNNTFRRGNVKPSGGRDSFSGNHDKKSFNGGFKRSWNEDNSSFKLQTKKSKVVDCNRRERRSLDAEKSIEENIKLHPSWEAKKNLNKGVVPFQGKKTTFDD